MWWTSMGFEAENAERRLAFADRRVDADMMRIAGRMLFYALPASTSW